MGRPARYSSQAILETASKLAAAHGPTGATITAIADTLGAPTGSIYHRFPSRDVLLAELWLQTVEAFQTGFQSALCGPDARAAGLEAALYTPRWVRAHAIPAGILLRHHREDFLPGGWPPEVTQRAVRLGEELEGALRSFARRALAKTSVDAVRRARYAVIDLPGAAVRPHLHLNEPPPPEIDDLITDAYSGVILAASRQDVRERPRS